MWNTVHCKCRQAWNHTVPVRSQIITETQSLISPLCSCHWDLLLQTSQSPTLTHRQERRRCHSSHGGSVLQPLLLHPQPNQRYLGSRHSSAHPQRPLPAGPVAGTASRPSARLKLAGQQRGRGCISFTTGRALPAARGTFLRTARDCSSLELAAAPAGQSSPTLQESNHRQFRQFLFSASTQLQAECK